MSDQLAGLHRLKQSLCRYNQACMWREVVIIERRDGAREIHTRPILLPPCDNSMPCSDPRLRYLRRASSAIATIRPGSLIGRVGAPHDPFESYVDTAKADAWMNYLER